MQVASLYPIHPMKVKIAEGVDAIVVDDPIWKKKKVLKKRFMLFKFFLRFILTFILLLCSFSFPFSLSVYISH